MIALVCFIWTVLVSPFKSKSGLAAESAVLRHQVTVLQRKLPRRIQLTNADRLFFVQLYMSKRGGPSGQTWGRSGDRTTGSAGAGLDQCHKTSDGGVDRTTNNRSLSLE
jgi:hypothetical protein